MELVPSEVEVRVRGAADALVAHRRATSDPTGEWALGPLAVRCRATPNGWVWSLANRGDAPVAVRSVGLRFVLRNVSGPVRLWRHGYQSWSPTGVVTVGVDEDPSRLANLEFIQAVHHADQHTTQPGELRSEWVGLLADHHGSPPLLVGFDGGDIHDGTVRVRGTDAGHVEVTAEAFLGDAVLGPGAERPLHDVVVDADPARDAAEKLARWASLVGARGNARVSAPFQVGWCSWYQYFHDVTEGVIDANLARADLGGWPFELFQVDDGYQAAIGDWLVTNDRFPSALDALAARIAAAGRRPGIWLAPFLAAPDSRVATGHPDWVAGFGRTGTNGTPLRTWWNPPWGGGEDGLMYGLDTTHPEVQAHLREVAAALVDAGFTYLKLDFTFSPSVDGRYHDPSMTPAERVRAGFEAVRAGAGPDTFLLGCGAPLANVVGLVDGVRIGQDVHPRWALEPGSETVPGYLAIEPATQHAYSSTVGRAFLHRRLWLNDPDCLMLRTTDTELTPAAARTWAHAVAVSGGMALVSDDLALLGAPERVLFDEVVERGRMSDAAARRGQVAMAGDLLDAPIPTRFRSAGGDLVVDPVTAESTLRGA